jgi:hypothetical protein
MHNLAAPEPYTWPTCTACHRNLWADEINRQACRPCETQTAERLDELNTLFWRINTTAALIRGANRISSNTSGTRTPPIPARLAPLGLATIGGVASRLQAIEDSWRAALGWTVAPNPGAPGRAVPFHIGFLRNNLLWACDAYESVSQDIDEIRHLVTECKNALDPGSQPGRVRIGPCPVRLDTGLCGAQLTATTASHKVRCPSCLTEWPDLNAWRDLRKAQEAAEQATQTTVAA